MLQRLLNAFSSANPLVLIAFGVGLGMTISGSQINPIEGNYLGLALVLGTLIYMLASKKSTRPHQ